MKLSAKTIDESRLELEYDLHAQFYPIEKNKREQNGSVGSFSIRNTNAEILLATRISLPFENLGNAGDLPILLSPRKSLAYLTSSTNGKSKNHQ